MKTILDAGAELKTLSASDLKNQLWDFVIIGAGSAGAMAAYLLAEKNSVLLIDQATFPREKTCGGCLSQGALRELDKAGLGNLASRLKAKPIHSVQIVYGGVSAQIQIPQGMSLSRKRLDSAMIEEAQKRGAVFLPETKGVLNVADDDTVRISLAQGDYPFDLRSKIALICDGLGGSSLQHFPELRANVASDSLVGISTSYEERAFDIADSTIRMACSPSGYVGMVVREDHRIEVAAAVRPTDLKLAGGSAAIVAKILREAGLKVPAGLAGAKWLGVPFLLRQRAVLGGKRFFVLGDAAGFIEPFTGEGMYWAFLQARELTMLLAKENFKWNDDLLRLWQIKSQEILNKPKRVCRLITLIVRLPFLCRTILWILNAFPKLGSWVAQSIHRDDVTPTAEHTSQPLSGDRDCPSTAL